MIAGIVRTLFESGDDVDTSTEKGIRDSAFRTLAFAYAARHSDQEPIQRLLEGAKEKPFNIEPPKLPKSVKSRAKAMTRLLSWLHWQAVLDIHTRDPKLTQDDIQDYINAGRKGIAQSGEALWGGRRSHDSPAKAKTTEEILSGAKGNILALLPIDLFRIGRKPTNIAGTTRLQVPVDAQKAEKPNNASVTEVPGQTDVRDRVAYELPLGSTAVSITFCP